jgi:hypothetical protein
MEAVRVRPTPKPQEATRPTGPSDELLGSHDVFLLSALQRSISFAKISSSRPSARASENARLDAE